MSFPQPQCEAIFLRRPQRFLAEIRVGGEASELAYFANSGAVTGCLVSGARALLWESADLKRKRRYTLRAVEFDGSWIGTDTHLANRIVEEALKLKLVPGLETYTSVTREQLVAEGVRVDFVLSGASGTCLVEVKSATVVENKVARFPDSLTPRGVRQLKALTRKAAGGQRVVLLFLVQRADAKSFVVSSSFDSTYAEAFDLAVSSGVEVLALAVSVSPDGFRTPRLLPYFQEAITSAPTKL